MLVSSTSSPLIPPRNHISTWRGRSWHTIPSRPRIWPTRHSLFSHCLATSIPEDWRCFLRVSLLPGFDSWHPFSPDLASTLPHSSPHPLSYVHNLTMGWKAIRGWRGNNGPEQGRRWPAWSPSCISGNVLVHLVSARGMVDQWYNHSVHGLCLWYIPCQVDWWLLPSVHVLSLLPCQLLMCQHSTHFSLTQNLHLLVLQVALQWLHLQWNLPKCIQSVDTQIQYI